MFDFGQSFKNAPWQKKTLGSCSGDLFVNEKVVQQPAMVDLDWTLYHLNAPVVIDLRETRMDIPKRLSNVVFFIVKCTKLAVLLFILPR